nr:SGNH hydrolase domain-containing protein [Pseudomonas sp. KSR10]
MPVEYTRYADPENICHGKIVNDCLKGDKSSDQEILVLGDSHAAMLNPFFEHLGEELRFKSRIVTASGCVTIDGFDIFSLPNWARAPCALQIEEANRYVSNADVIFIAGKWSQHILNANFNGSLHRFIKTHSSEAKNIYLISQVPQFKGNPLRAERFRKLGIPLELERDPAAVKGNAVIENIAAQYPNVHYLDFTGLDVFSNAPFYDDKLIYRDEHHINEVGSRIYAQAARPVLAGLKFCLALGCGIHSEKASPLMKALR